MRRNALYGGNDPRDLPAYTIADAARYTHVPAATLRSWFLGRTYPRRTGGRGSFDRLMVPASHTSPNLSFSNLIEAHVLRALRTQHDVSIADVRAALEFAEKQLKLERLLLRDELRTAGGELFLDRYGELINLSKSGQYAIRRLLAEYLKRIEYANHIPVRLYPFLNRGQEADAKPIVIDPRVSFGRPIIAGTGIMTRTMIDRVDAGESIEEIAEDFGLPIESVEAAILFEKAA